MNAQAVCDRIKSRGGGRVTVALFEDQPWRSKDEALSSVGLRPEPDCKWFEVSRDDAQALISAALSRDLCYGTQVMSLDEAERLVAEFFDLMHFQTRCFTNSHVPYHRHAPNAWSFSHVGPGTLSTGVAFELAKRLTGVLWISDSD